MVVGLVLQVMLAPTALALPEIKLGTGVAVTPAQADSWYAAQGLASPTWSEDPELKRLAAALGNDPDRVYSYVRNEIDVVPLFGIHAGARGCYIDKACTPFDQAELMVELLRSAGVVASYQMGTVTLTGAQFNGWFGITNAAAARKLLADGGFPATVSGTTTVTSVTLSHLWVRATIGGVNYVFDPAFKAHTTKAGVNLATAIGLNAASFHAGAISGSSGSTTNGTAQVSGLNRAGVRSSLGTMATTLLNYVRTSFPTGAIEDLIGGRSIAPYTGGPLRQATLPYSSTVTATFTGDVPLVLRTRVTLGFFGNAQPRTLSWNLNDIYGNQITFEAHPEFRGTGLAQISHPSGRDGCDGLAEWRDHGRDRDREPALCRWHGSRLGERYLHGSCGERWRAVHRRASGHHRQRSSVGLTCRVAGAAAYGAAGAHGVLSLVG
jgi:hypothetical protein